MAEESKADKFCNASLDSFDDEALEMTLAAMELVVKSPTATNEVKMDAYATFGKVALELERREAN